MNKKITLKQVKAGVVLPSPIYNTKPYVVLSNEGVVLAAGTRKYLLALPAYFNDFRVEVRKHDLHANDNSKVQKTATREARQIEIENALCDWFSARISAHQHPESLAADKEANAATERLAGLLNPEIAVIFKG